jgi:tetratricopeptide (TPR) repeat protein
MPQGGEEQKRMNSAMLISTELPALLEKKAPTRAQPRKEDLKAITRRGILRAKQGDLAGAIEDYSAALQIDAQHLAALANRGVARFHHDDFQGAIDDCTLAIDIAPSLSKAWLIRGLAHARLGLREAEEDLAQFAQLDSSSKYLPMARKALEELDRE